MRLDNPGFKLFFFFFFFLVFANKGSCSGVEARLNEFLVRVEADGLAYVVQLLEKAQHKPIDPSIDYRSLILLLPTASPPALSFT